MNYNFARFSTISISSISYVACSTSLLVCICLFGLQHLNNDLCLVLNILSVMLNTFILLLIFGNDLSNTSLIYVVMITVFNIHS